MRANIGIRRRLASLLDNSRAEIELINPLLLSPPGTPRLYYGDEIGMGDNIWLQDRDAVRTPMQWTPDRNAGFSAADPGKVYLPVVQSLVHHYAAVNVEAQLASSSSLLHWVRGMLALRRRHPVFGLGSFVPLVADNPAVLAFLRVLSDGEVDDEPGETVLCVHNLSGTPQSARIPLPALAGSALLDLFGGAGFQPVPADGQVIMTIGSRDFFWLQVGEPAARREEGPRP
jgi:maltose alpha-D-glucosyltransferase/alpha-amylase